MKNLQKNLIIYLKKIKILYRTFTFLKKKIYQSYNFIMRNRSLIIKNKSTKYNENVFVLDTRIVSLLFDSFVLLIRSCNFFYNDEWIIIIYEDKFFRYNEKHVNKEIYKNNLINIFLQSILILPNPPRSIKFIDNREELFQIIKNSNKIFPEDYNFLSDNKAYLIGDFNEKDFENFKINKPILKATKYYSEIFEKYLNYRNIKEYITITIRTKNWSTSDWNTDVEDIKLYIDFIKKNNLKNHEIIIIPDTQQDVPKEIMEIIKNENLKYHLFHHGSFSIPMRFLAYSNASFNLASTNGPLAMLWFIKNDAFFILKDSNQGEDVKNFVDKFNKNIFLDRKFYFHKRY